jgi:DNA processing protein
MAGALPEEAWAIALAGLPEMGPSRLRAVLQAGAPAAAWAAVAAGRGAALLERAGVAGDVAAIAAQWGQVAACIDVEGTWQRHASFGVGVALEGTQAYPSVFVDDVDPPVVVFSLGDPSVLRGPRVAIVGTRSATRYGLDLAFELGLDLARAGVGIVSGLALGIDGAAHAGALDAGGAPGSGPPIAVVGSGLDVLYPAAHRALWRAVAARGVVLSEAPLGTRPQRWRFPARNRLIAALADVVVVVESRERGGSMITVEEALRRDRPVMAVPGPVRSASSVGTNRLLGDCAMPVADAGDVLVALGLTPGAQRTACDSRPAPDPSAQVVLDALGWQPASVDQLLLRTGLELGALLVRLDALGATGWVAVRAGWYEQVAVAS